MMDRVPHSDTLDPGEGRGLADPAGGAGDDNDGRVFHGYVPR